MSGHPVVSDDSGQRAVGVRGGRQTQDEAVDRLLDFQQGYSGLQSAFYDAVIAPGTLAAARPLLGQILAAAPDHGRVLDIGCGGGQALTAPANARPDLRLAGVDASRPLVRRARAHTAGRADLQVASAQALPYSDGAVDVVYSLFSIKHWPDRQRGLTESARVARPGGLLLVAEIDSCADPERWQAFVVLTRIPRPLQHVYVAATLRPIVRRSVTPAELRAAAADLPLTDATVTTDPTLAITLLTGTIRPPA
jgi:ubiquinone/menaquinone biosynthesis C-methylase UbiE